MAIKTLVTIFFLFNIFLCLHAITREELDQFTMPPASEFRFIEQAAPFDIEQSPEADLLKDFANGQEIAAVCHRMDNSDSTIDSTQLCYIHLAPQISCNPKFVEMINRYRTSSDEQFLLSPFMIAALRDDKEFLHSILEKRSRNDSCEYMNRDLMIANELAIMGFEYPLAALIFFQSQLIKDKALQLILTSSPLYLISWDDSDSHPQNYWYLYYSELQAHSLIYNLPLSQQDIKKIASRIIKQVDRVHSFFIVEKIFQAINNKLQESNLEHTFGNVTQIVTAGIFRTKLFDLDRQATKPPKGALEQFRFLFGRTSVSSQYKAARTAAQSIDHNQPTRIIAFLRLSSEENIPDHSHSQESFHFEGEYRLFLPPSVEGFLPKEHQTEDNQTYLVDPFAPGRLVPVPSITNYSDYIQHFLRWKKSQESSETVRLSTPEEEYLRQELQAFATSTLGWSDQLPLHPWLTFEQLPVADHLLVRGFIIPHTLAIFIVALSFKQTPSKATEILKTIADSNDELITNKEYSLYDLLVLRSVMLRSNCNTIF